MLQISISRGEGHPLYLPSVFDGAAWETEADAPGRFTCGLPDSPGLDIGEGYALSAVWAGEKVFYGHIFSRRYDESGLVRVTAYDQMRYLKYRDSVAYDGVTASALLRRVAAPHPSLRVGETAETGVLLEPKAEDGKALLDILRGALRETEAAGGGRFILYDDFGRLTLRRAWDLRRDVWIGAENGRAFVRTLSIDIDTYNHIKLICDTRRGRSVTVASDAGTEAEWGKLQYTERIADDFNARFRAEELLKRHNRARREISVGGVPGRPAVRAGCSVVIAKELAGGDGDALCFVERARHVWRDGGYVMDLDCV